MKLHQVAGAILRKVLVSGVSAMILGAAVSQQAWGGPIIATSLSQFTGTVVTDTFCALPTQNPPVTTVSLGHGVTTPACTATDINGGYWGLGSNGCWGNISTLTGGNPLIGHCTCCLTSGTNPLIFDFATPVSEVGACMNYNPMFGPGLQMRALTASCVCVGFLNISGCPTYNICTHKPVLCCDCESEFRGFINGVADISKFEITGQDPVLRNISFGVVTAIAAPEVDTHGASLPALLSLSLLAMAADRRRRC